MKVWYITMIFPAPAETFAGIEVRTLRKMGADISVYSLRMAHPDQERFLGEWGLEGVPVDHATWLKILQGVFEAFTRPLLMMSLLYWIVRSTWHKPEHLFKSILLLPRTLQLFKNIEKKKPEVVHLFWGHYPAMLGRLVQRFCPETVVSMFLGAYDLAWNYGCSALVAQNADVVWTHVAYNVPAIQALGVPPEKIQLSYRGIDLSKAKKASITKVKRRIVTAGRLIKLKGIESILRVFHKVKKRWSDASLVVLGEGPERKGLEALALSLGIMESVDFKGHVPHSLVFEEMLKAEIFISMSTFERIPNVVKEAMACRCLCLVTKTDGIDELIEDGRTGYILSRDIDAVAERVNHAFSGQGATKDIVDGAYHQVVSKFDVEQTVSKIKDRWERLTLEKRGCLAAPQQT